jgi:Rha family phage regulatory protein
MLNNINVEIQNNDGLLVVSSQVIARELNKEHKYICRKINQILKVESGVWENFTTPPQKDFEAIETTSTNPQNNQEYKEYLLTKDGFTLLVMNYTGYNDFKRAYIKKFNQMEQALKNNALAEQTELKPQDQTPVIAKNATTDQTPTVRKSRTIELTTELTTELNQPVDKDGFYLYPLTCATSPSKLRYKIEDGTIYFKASDIDSILEISKLDLKSDMRTATNYTIHHVLHDIGIMPYGFELMLNIWQILELCEHIKSKRAELLENVFLYKVKPYFERKIGSLIKSNLLTA